MLARRQTVDVETTPLESEYWQTRTEPLDSEYWEPFWAARIVYMGGVILFAAGIICFIIVLVASPPGWLKVAGWCGGILAFLLALVRQKQRMRLLRDAGLQGRIRKFRAYRKRDWDSSVRELAADSSVNFMDGNGVVLANPVAGESTRRVLLVKQGNLLAELHERKQRVGSVDLALITSNQAEPSPN